MRVRHVERPWALVALMTVALSAIPSTSAAASDEFARHFREGVGHFRAGGYTKATDSLHQALEIRADHSGAHFYMGLTHHKRGEFAGAINHLRRALLQDPSLDSDIAHLYLGLSMYRLELYLSALEAFTRVIRLDDRSRLARIARDHIHRIEKIYESAPSPGTRRYYQREGLGAFEQGRHQHAAAHLDELRRIDERFGPSEESADSDLLLYLVASLNHLERHSEVLALLSDEAAHSAPLELHRGRALLASGRVSAARAAFERVSRMEKDSPWAEAATFHLSALGRNAPEDS